MNLEKKKVVSEVIGDLTQYTSERNKKGMPRHTLKKYKTYYSMLFARFAATNALLSTIVIVNGPTPPGTGVM